MICVCPLCGEEGNLRKTQNQEGHSFPFVNEEGEIAWTEVDWYETEREYVICDSCNEIIDESDIITKEE